MICISDKTGKLIAVHPDIYQQMGEVHTAGDRIIADWECQDIQKRLNHQTSAWIEMTRLGQQWEHEDRFRETCINKSASIPALSLLIKDHKQMGLVVCNNSYAI